MVDGSEAVAGDDQDWTTKLQDQVCHGVVFAQGNEQTPYSFDQKNIATARHRSNFPQNSVKMNYFPPPAAGSRGNGLGAEKRVDFLQCQQVFLQAVQEAGVGAGTGTKGFDGQGVAVRLSQMAQEQCCQDRFPDACVRARNENNFCHPTLLEHLVVLCC
jgi:hypothetical protein